MIPFGLSGIAVVLSLLGQPGLPDLDRRLLSENPETLARQAIEQGDATRGARVFYRPQLACARCHVAGDWRRTRSAPTWPRSGKEATDAHLVESILAPSKVDQAGVTRPSRSPSPTARTLDRPARRGPARRVVLRDPRGATASSSRSPKARSRSGRSAGPVADAGRAWSTSSRSRQEFLDLVRYLREIADGGPDRARQLRPSARRARPAPLPDYERDLDHAGLIAGLGPESFQRGEAIYERVCANCHGTKDRPGSLPTSLRFASGTFKNGGDPYRMYQTLTLGFGQMAAQAWMVPRQKYDVIHYIREAYLKAAQPLAVSPRSTATTSTGCPEGQVARPRARRPSSRGRRWITARP